MTANEIFERAIALVDLITDAGAVDTAKTADYKARTPYLINLHQMELIKTGDLYTKYPIAYRPLDNILTGGSHFTVEEHGTTDISIETADGDVAKVYYFEADGASGTVYIEDYTGTWNTKATVSLANTGMGFVPYTALVTPTSGATKSRIRFSGSYYYRYRNVALHAESFSNISRVYNYGEKIKIALPSTVHSVHDVIFKSLNSYAVQPQWEVEFNGTIWELLFDRSFNGEILVTYIPNPTKVTSTALSDTLTIDDYSADVMAYMLAEDFMTTDMNDYLAGVFRNRWHELVANSPYRKAKPMQKITDMYLNRAGF